MGMGRNPVLLANIEATRVQSMLCSPIIGDWQDKPPYDSYDHDKQAYSGRPNICNVTNISQQLAPKQSPKATFQCPFWKRLLRSCLQHLPEQERDHLTAGR